MDNLNLESAIKTLKSKTSYTSADMKDVLNIYLKATKVDMETISNRKAFKKNLDNVAKNILEYNIRCMDTWIKSSNYSSAIKAVRNSKPMTIDEHSNLISKAVQSGKPLLEDIQFVQNSEAFAAMPNSSEKKRFNSFLEKVSTLMDLYTKDNTQSSSANDKTEEVKDVPVYPTDANGENISKEENRTENKEGEKMEEIKNVVNIEDLLEGFESQTDDFDVADLLKDPSAKETTDDFDVADILGDNQSGTTSPANTTAGSETKAKKGILWKIFSKRRELLAAAEKELDKYTKELKNLKKKTPLSISDNNRILELEEKIPQTQNQIKELKSKGVRNGIIHAVAAVLLIAILITSIAIARGKKDGTEIDQIDDEFQTETKVDDESDTQKPIISTQSVQTLATLNNSIIGQLTKVSNYKIANIETIKINDDKTLSIIANCVANNGTKLTREFTIKSNDENAQIFNNSINTLNVEAAVIALQDDDEKSEKNYLAIVNDLLTNAKEDDITEKSFSKPHIESTTSITSNQIKAYAYLYYSDSSIEQKIINGLNTSEEDAVKIEIISQNKQAFVKTKIGTSIITLEFELPSNMSKSQSIKFIENKLAELKISDVKVDLSLDKHEVAMNEISSSLEAAN